MHRLFITCVLAGSIVSISGCKMLSHCCGMGGQPQQASCPAPPAVQPYTTAYPPPYDGAPAAMPPGGAYGGQPLQYQPQQ